MVMMFYLNTKQSGNETKQGEIPADVKKVMDVLNNINNSGILAPGSALTTSPLTIAKWREQLLNCVEGATPEEKGKRLQEILSLVITSKLASNDPGQKAIAGYIDKLGTKGEKIAQQIGYVTGFLFGMAEDKASFFEGADFNEGAFRTKMEAILEKNMNAVNGSVDGIKYANGLETRPAADFTSSIESNPSGFIVNKPLDFESPESIEFFSVKFQLPAAFFVPSGFPNGGDFQRILLDGVTVLGGSMDQNTGAINIPKTSPKYNEYLSKMSGFNAWLDSPTFNANGDAVKVWQILNNDLAAGKTIDDLRTALTSGNFGQLKTILKPGTMMWNALNLNSQNIPSVSSFLSAVDQRNLIRSAYSGQVSYTQKITRDGPLGVQGYLSYNKALLLSNETVTTTLAGAKLFADLKFGSGIKFKPSATISAVLNSETTPEHFVDIGGKVTLPLSDVFNIGIGALVRRQIGAGHAPFDSYQLELGAGIRPTARLRLEASTLLKSTDAEPSFFDNVGAKFTAYYNITPRINANLNVKVPTFKKGSETPWGVRTTAPVWMEIGVGYTLP